MDLLKQMDKIRKKAIKASAKTISAPARIKSSYIQKRADNEVKILKNARNSKGAPKFDSKGNPTDAFKYKVAADRVKKNIQSRRKKR